jgi:large subunit ribosomal protein L6
MSRIGKKPVAVPSGVTATAESGTLTVKGPKGTLTMAMLDDLVRYDIKDGEISITPVNPSQQRARAAWGMQRTNVQNLVTGVTEGFTKVLEITGVGYRAAAQGKNLRLQLGYSHDVNYPVPEGIEVKTPDPNTVEISGIDRQKVGQVAAEIRRWRKPEPYKGKGIKYRGEFIFRKEGKKK